MVYYHPWTKPKPEKQVYLLPRHMIVISKGEGSYVVLRAFVRNHIDEIISFAWKCLVVKLGAHIDVIAEIIPPFRISVVFVWNGYAIIDVSQEIRRITYTDFILMAVVLS